jgi:cytochrome b involved in lipid metabolism
MTPPRASGNPKSASKPAFLLALVLLVFATIFAPSQAEAVTNATPENQTTLTNSISETDPTQTVKGIGRAVAASYTIAEVAQNNSRSSCWTVISGFVYNITDYIKRHPGGEAAISKICGVDGTAIFNNMHGGAAAQAIILSTYKIGVLGAPPVTSCFAGYFVNVSQNSCAPAPVGYFVTSEASAAGVTSATPCPAGMTTATTASKSVNDCYKPIVQSIVGFKAPKGLKFNGTTNLALITNTKTVSAFTVAGPCTAKLTNVVTKVKGKKVTTKMLKVTAGKKAGTCSIKLTSPTTGKYLGLSKAVKIKVSKTGK